MGWLVKERGPAWKQGWTHQILASISTPPLPLLGIFGILSIFLSLSCYLHFRQQVKRTVVSFKLILLFLPVALIILTSSIKKYPSPRKIVRQAKKFPWGLAALIVVLLVMVYYQSLLHSMWSPPLWRSF